MDLKDISYHCFSAWFLIVALWPKEMQITYVSTELISADLLEFCAYFRDIWSQGADPG